MGAQGAQIVYIGSYAEQEEAGVSVCTFDAQSGQLTLQSQITGLKNPTFLDLDRDGGRLYAIGEQTGDDGVKYGIAAAFRIERDTGALQLINQARTTPASTCHIALDHTRRCLIVSSYHGGMVGLSELLDDGSVGAAIDIKRHEGRSVLPVQSQARAHSVAIDRHNRYAIACDLGLDKLIIYRLDVSARALTPHDEVRTAPGAGPRHFAFHPSGKFAYVINELNASIIAYAYDEEAGRLRELQTVPTLPADWQGDNACADIHISPDGRFLYGSNRGHDSIVVYRIDPATGRLTYVQHEPTGGAHPRNFALSPDGRFLLAANRDTNNIVTFRRNEADGKLTATGHELQLSKPVCVKFL